MRKTRERWLAVALFAALSGVARAEPLRAAPDAPGFVLGTRALARNAGGGLELDVRHRFDSRVELGVELRASYLSEAYLSGQAVSPAVATGGGVVLLVPALSSDRIDAFFRYVPGVTFLGALEDDEQALRFDNELGAFAHVLLGSRGLVRTGVVLGVDLEVVPTFELADQAQLLTLGYGHALSEQLLCYADVTAGGTFGFNGDNGKIIVEASLGLRFSLAEGGARGPF